MLTIGKNVLRTQDYCVRHLYSGYDELVFSMSIYDDQYKLITEEAQIVDRGALVYAVKAIDGGAETAQIKAQLDLDELRAQLFLNYTNGSATVQNTVAGVLPSGWSIVDKTGLQIKRTVTAPGATAAEIIELCRDTYGVAFRFDNAARTVTIYPQAAPEPLGAFVTRDLNLKELNYKGKSTSFATRLYAYGKDGMSFADINNGLPYVDNNTYSSKVVCAYWSDERYTIAENLLADAQAKLATMAVPSRSYACSVMDLAKTNPGVYNFETFQMMESVTLIDDIRGTAIPHQIVEYWEYPYQPEENIVTLSTTTPKITSQVSTIVNNMNNPNSGYQQQLAASISAATNLILNGNGGYVVLDTNEAGAIYQILIMDTPSKETAMNVWRWNLGGLGHSTNGVNGPYTTAITQDGQIVANFITAGTFTATGSFTTTYTDPDTGDTLATSLTSGTLEFFINGQKGARIVNSVRDGVEYATLRLYREGVSLFQAGGHGAIFLYDVGADGQPALRVSLASGVNVSGEAASPGLFLFDTDGNVIGYVAVATSGACRIRANSISGDSITASGSLTGADLTASDSLAIPGDGSIYINGGETGGGYQGWQFAPITGADGKQYMVIAHPY